MSSTILSCGEPDSSVWKIEGKESTLFIGGTIHALRHDDYPLPPQFDRAYSLADKLVFERNMSDEALAIASAQMIITGTYQDERTLENVLSREVFKALRAECEKNGLDIRDIHSHKPSLALLVLSVSVLERLGAFETGVDRYFYALATKDNKSLDVFESVGEQIHEMMNIGAGYEDEYIMASLKDIQNMEEDLDEIIQGWRNGSPDAMIENLNDLCKNSPLLYKAMCADRNSAWMPKIESLLADNTVEFVLVGAEHLYGPNGVLTLLKDKGYAVEKLKM
ncbi:MAG: TraB/GumN family protein [Flavobacteriales bacterium]|nr:TraB/GumN family protein [Flavobacteriales bacterium]